MERVIAGSFLLVASAAVVACAGTRRAPVPMIASLESAKSCATTVEGSSIERWRTVRADGFTFCVPQSWSLDERYQRIAAKPRTTGYLSFSWAAPDTAQRVIIEVPFRDVTQKDLQNELAKCRFLGQNGQGVRLEIAGQDLCAKYVGQGFSRGVVITYPEPLVRVTAIGAQDARTVVQTIRPVVSSQR